MLKLAFYQLKKNVDSKVKTKDGNNSKENYNKTKVDKKQEPLFNHILIFFEELQLNNLS